MSLSTRISSMNEFYKWIEKISVPIKPPSIVLLTGDLGAGKTEFVKYFCKLKKIDQGASQVTSPTFSLHNRYQLEGLTVDHFDLYRLQSSDEIEGSGFWDTLSQMTDQTVVFIEWPERIQLKDLPLNVPKFTVQIKKIDARHRDLMFKTLV